MAWQLGRLRRPVRACRAFRPENLSGRDRLEDRTVPTTLAPGFSQTVVVSGLNSPTAMAFAPDGRVFVAEQDGTVVVVQNGQVLPTPFLKVNAFPSSERGLVGLALDPNFEVNHYVYIYYTTASAPFHNRVSRFTADGNVAEPGSETVLLELDPINTKQIFQHVGGSLVFGADGKLYVGVGDLGNKANAQLLKTRTGKILRINPDGTIPTDNPFYTRLKGPLRAIWAFGLRNPYTAAVDPVSGLYLINDVGLASWERIFPGAPGANYGWPKVEGPNNNPRFTHPLFAYPHGPNEVFGTAITGGTFYRSASPTSFPSDFQGSYFFADLENDWIHRLRFINGQAVVSDFADQTADHPVALEVDAAGNLDYLSRGSGGPGAIYSIHFTPPT
ncbi:MAG TPA: PQQ-dependent sugar dehydrogenase [Isosphaeraceae bacterium]|jgi:glucose/arabinose dehydrogenase|nr:PQQ-dependent sugar dehydrogenase [Isosphaeraceae bacterium]